MIFDVPLIKFCNAFESTSIAVTRAFDAFEIAVIDAPPIFFALFLTALKTVSFLILLKQSMTFPR